MLSSLLVQEWLAELLWYGMIALFFGVPLISAVCFFVSLVKFLKTPKEDEKRAKRKVATVSFGVAAAILVGGCIFVTSMFLYGIANM